MDMETVSHVSLGTLLGVVIVYFIFENTVLDNYIRFLLTPYLGNSLIGFLACYNLTDSLLLSFN